MKKIITLCLLIICVIVTGCGNAAGSGSLNNTPVIYNVTPNDSSSIANSVDSNGNVTVTLTGTNFGSRNEDSRVYYNGYVNESSTTPQRTALSFVNGGTWSENQVSVILYQDTRERFPYGTFSIIANGHESPATARYNFGGGNLTNASVTDWSPKIVYGYSTEQNYMTIEGSGFGTVPQDLLIFNYNGYNKTISKTEIYNWTNTRIVLPLPLNEIANSVTSNTTLFIRSTNSNNTISNLASFEYKTSQITNITPAEGSLGKILTVTGQGFGATQSNMYMYIGDSFASIVSGSWTENSFQVRVPNFTTTGSKNIKLRVNGNDTQSNFTYEVRAPMFYSISKSVDLAEGDNVTIYGNYFGNKEDLQAIYQTGRIEITDTNNNSTNVISMTDANVTWTENTITFVWPKISSNLLSTKTFNIKIIVGSLVSSNSINVTD
ncbi:MAG: IPT/TIG domain-containing protein [Candidatus Riflebacteria bacterium]|nr:IPT/TIG domain-containing protein [Candidatus Riflebacteria bacterium]